VGLDRIDLNDKGVRELLKSAEVLTSTDKRARAVVITDTPEARLGEARHRNLTRAIDAGRR
jgi:hypothetical protein